jgi:spermidine synthase
VTFNERWFLEIKPVIFSQMAQITRLRTYLFPATMGFVSFVAQMIILRRLVMVFGGNELVCGAALAGWLGFAGLGRLLGRAIASRTTNLKRFIVIVFFLLAFAIPATTAATYLIRTALGITPQAEVGLLTVFAIAIGLMAPRGLLVGAASVLWRDLACELNIYHPIKSRGSLALGTAVGGIAYSLIIIHLLNPLEAGIIIGLILIAITGFAVGSGRMRYGAIALCFVMTAVGASGSFIESGLAKLQWRGHDLIIEKETALFELAVVADGADRTLYQDGYPIFTLPSPQSYESIANLPIVEHPAPKDIAVIGGGVSGMVAQWGGRGINSATFIRADEEITRLERDEMESDLGNLPEWAQVIHGDARKIFRDGLPGGCTKSCLDLIIINVGNTNTASRNRFFTTNFFDEARTVLRGDGVIALVLPGMGKPPRGERVRDVGSIRRSLAESFKNEAIVPLNNLFFFASAEPGALTSDFMEIKRRLLASDTSGDYFLSWLLSAEGVENAGKTVEQIKLASKNAPLNTDIQPAAYRLGMTRLDRFERWPFIAALAILLAGSLLIFRRNKSELRTTWVLGALGFATMTFEIILLIRYQMETGLLMVNIGYVLAAYSVGVSLGTVAVRSWIKAVGADDRVLASAIVFLAAYIFAGIIFMKAGFVPANLLIGVLTGWIYCFTTHPLREEGDSFGMSNRLIVNSHNWGAATGTIIMSTIAIPLFGLQGGLMIASTTLIAGLVAVLATRR